MALDLAPGVGLIGNVSGFDFSCVSLTPRINRSAHTLLDSSRQAFVSSIWSASRVALARLVQQSTVIWRQTDLPLDFPAEFRGMLPPSPRHVPAGQPHVSIGQIRRPQMSNDATVQEAVASLIKAGLIVVRGIRSTVSPSLI